MTMTRKEEAKKVFNQVLGVYKRYGIGIKKHGDYATKQVLANVIIATL